MRPRWLAVICGRSHGQSSCGLILEVPLGTSCLTLVGRSSGSGPLVPGQLRAGVFLGKHLAERPASRSSDLGGTLKDRLPAIREWSVGKDRAGAGWSILPAVVIVLQRSIRKAASYACRCCECVCAANSGRPTDRSGFASLAVKGSAAHLAAIARRFESHAGT